MKTFSERVVEIARSIPRGKVTTYGRIARAAGGGARAAQSITSILSKAYDSGVEDIPFHRIVYADGHIWIDNRHRKKRLKRYAAEGIRIDVKGQIGNFTDRLLDFD